MHPPPPVFVIQETGGENEWWKEQKNSGVWQIPGVISVISYKRSWGMYPLFFEV